MIGTSTFDLARARPGKPAVIMGDSRSIRSFGDLEMRSNQAAHLFRSLGLKPGDVVGFCLENCLEVFDFAFGALRAGLMLVPISSKLTASEIEYIARDSGARLLLTSPGIGGVFFAIPGAVKGLDLFATGEPAAHYRSWNLETAEQSVAPIADESMGAEMLYSSGTTGRPKGIQWTKDGKVVGLTATAGRSLFVINDETVYLSPAPLYHTAPFRSTLATVRAGGTAVVMEHFDAEQALALIERHKVTVCQWVPTHFVRLLKLPVEVRSRYDISSLQVALHGAAPCPVPVKQAMIDWFGPIVREYFGSTEQTTLTVINSQEWLEHPGSVGRCVRGKLHICDDEGNPLPAGSIGTIFSESDLSFEYHNAPDKTAQSKNGSGWATVGDVGYLDEDGYLFLTDRKGFMIITGGVNVYPQEIENLLVTHPRVADAAVIGTPDPEMGERVTAIIQPIDMSDATPAFAQELRSWMRESLSGVKVPKRIEFQAELPRLPTGKMQKFALRERYSQ